MFVEKICAPQRRTTRHTDRASLPTPGISGSCATVQLIERWVGSLGIADKAGRLSSLSDALFSTPPVRENLRGKTLKKKGAKHYLNAHASFALCDQIRLWLLELIDNRLIEHTVMNILSCSEGKSPSILPQAGRLVQWAILKKKKKTSGCI